MQKPAFAKPLIVSGVMLVTMPGSWRPDPFGRNQYRWFDGSSWTEHVANNGLVSTDPVSADEEVSSAKRVSSASANVRQGDRNTDSKPVGVIGGLAGIGAGYAVLVYLGIPSGFVLYFYPPLGILMCGFTIWLAIRTSRRVSRATQRGVDVVSSRIAEFIAELRSYESKWGAWTPPDSDGPSFGFGGNKRSTSEEERERSRDYSHNSRGKSGGHAPSPYEILGVSEGASQKEVRAAFHKLMMAVHPDRHANKSPEERSKMEDQAKVITEAYNAIKK